jgi:hypothetical protein
MLPIPHSVPRSPRTQNCKCDLSGKCNPIALPPASSLTLKELEKCMVLREVLLYPPAMQHDWSSRLSSLPLSRAGTSHASPLVACSAHSTNLPFSRFAIGHLPSPASRFVLFPSRSDQAANPSWERNPLRAPSGPHSRGQRGGGQCRIEAIRHGLTYRKCLAAGSVRVDHARHAPCSFRLVVEWLIHQKWWDWAAEQSSWGGNHDTALKERKRTAEMASIGSPRTIRSPA